MTQLLARKGKKVERMLPIAARFVSDTMTPLLADVDGELYAQQARSLKVAEDYAVRLLREHRSRKEARRCARHFAGGYSEHGFVIDADEASDYLNIARPSRKQALALAELEEWLTGNHVIALGPLLVADELSDEPAGRPRNAASSLRARSPVA